MIGKARMIRAERERAKRKAEEEKKKEEEKAKKEKKDKKKKKKEKDSTKSEEEKEESKESDPTEPPGKPYSNPPPPLHCDDEDAHVSEELLELVPDLIWAVVEPGKGDVNRDSLPENLVMPRRHEQPSPSFLETLFILILIHLLFEYIR